LVRGNAARLNRAGDPQKERRRPPIEELVAELGSAFLCADLQITPEVREDHASYIENWLKILNVASRYLLYRRHALAKCRLCC
jgi:antirestriction protein ArdC